MATRKCPHCGKKISGSARYCVYCKTKFNTLSDLENADNVSVIGNDKAADSAAETAVEDTRSRKALWLPISILSAVVICVVVIVSVVGVYRAGILAGGHTQNTDNAVSTAVPTQPTRDPDRDVFLQHFTGYWVDENSVGKKDVTKQGGMELKIIAIAEDTVLLDILSHTGGETPATAFLNGISVTADSGYMMLFSFEDDGLGHSGEGCLRFREDAVDAEIVIDGAEMLGENDHSLKMNTVFKRPSLPQAEGHDIVAFTSLDSIKAVCGEPIGEPVVNETSDETTYTFTAMTVAVNADGAVKHIIVDCSQTEGKTAYRYDRVNGTMSYEVIKTYFGEAEHDYTEQPTDIRVLHYVHSETSYTTFVFNARTDELIKIQYDL